VDGVGEDELVVVDEGVVKVVSGLEGVAPVEVEGVELAVVVVEGVDEVILVTLGMVDVVTVLPVGGMTFNSCDSTWRRTCNVASISCGLLGLGLGIGCTGIGRGG